MSTDPMRGARLAYGMLERPHADALFAPLSDPEVCARLEGPLGEREP
jgi:hypothetical protein